jgi:hypothetical protein
MSEELVPKAEVTVALDAEGLPTPIKDALAPGQGAPPVAAQRASQAWYLTWGLFPVPYRVIRRGSRKRRRNALQHRELLAAIRQNDE